MRQSAQLPRPRVPRPYDRHTLSAVAGLCSEASTAFDGFDGFDSIYIVGYVVRSMTLVALGNTVLGRLPRAAGGILPLDGPRMSDGLSATVARTGVVLLWYSLCHSWAG